MAIAWELFLSGTLSETQEYFVRKLFDDEDFLESRCFSTLHKAILGLSSLCLSSLLQSSTADIDVTDAYGRTCLVWYG